MSQTANGVASVLSELSRYKVRTYLFARMAKEVVWIGCVKYLNKQRLFTIHGADTPKPTLKVLSKDQANISGCVDIDEIDVTAIEYTLTIDELTDDGYSGVIRKLGLLENEDSEDAIDVILEYPSDSNDGG